MAGVTHEPGKANGYVRFAISQRSILPAIDLVERLRSDPSFSPKEEDVRMLLTCWTVAKRINADPAENLQDYISRDKSNSDLKSLKENPNVSFNTAKKEFGAFVDGKVHTLSFDDISFALKTLKIAVHI